MLSSAGLRGLFHLCFPECYLVSLFTGLLELPHVPGTRPGPSPGHQVTSQLRSPSAIFSGVGFSRPSSTGQPPAGLLVIPLLFWGVTPSGQSKRQKKKKKQGFIEKWKELGVWSLDHGSLLSLALASCVPLNIQLAFSELQCSMYNTKSFLKCCEG